MLFFNTVISEQEKTNRRNIVVGLFFAIILGVALYFGITNASKSVSYTPPMNVSEVEQQYHIDIVNEEGMPFEPENGSYVIQAYDQGDQSHMRTFYAKVSDGGAVLFVKDNYGYAEVLK